MICLGDSIAVGLSCEVSYARVGVGSDEAVQNWLGVQADVISLGSNDPLNPSLYRNLDLIRGRISGQVVWIVPRHPRARRIVRELAGKWGDRVVEFVAKGDGVHPRSYLEVRRRLAP